MKRILLSALSTFVLFSQAHAAESVCTQVGPLDRIYCPSKNLDVKGPHITRSVKYSVPEGKAPRGGWPAVVIYQGSFFPVEFTRNNLAPFGGYNEVRLIESLLNKGFAVIAPPAIAGLYWMTNLTGIDYNTSEDFYFIEEMLKQIGDGAFGKINMNRLYATGISSGGYHTSRMAVSFPGVFRALAVESASYATCGGPLCVLPKLSHQHPPTLFLHGEKDIVVPVATMLPYYEELRDSGVDTEAIIDQEARHQWLDAAPEMITNWFLTH